MHIKRFVAEKGQILSYNSLFQKRPFWDAPPNERGYLKRKANNIGWSSKAMAFQMWRHSIRTLKSQEHQ